MAELCRKSAPPPVGCVIMASGLARRFGSNKLLADFRGRPLLCRALEVTATPALAARVVVTRSAGVKALCDAQAVPCLLHSLPGRNDTVRLGLEALLEQCPGLAGCIFLPGDQRVVVLHEAAGHVPRRLLEVGAQDVAHLEQVRQVDVLRLHQVELLVAVLEESISVTA